MTGEKIVGSIILVGVALTVLARRAVGAVSPVEDVSSFGPVEPVTGPGSTGPSAAPYPDGSTSGVNTPGVTLPATPDGSSWLVKCSPLNTFPPATHGVNWSAYLAASEAQLLVMGVLTPEVVSRARNLSPAQAAAVDLDPSKAWRAFDYRTSLPIQCG